MTRAGDNRVAARGREATAVSLLARMLIACSRKQQCGGRAAGSNNVAGGHAVAAVTVSKGTLEGPMTFAGMNYLAVVIAAVAGWLVGAAWYGLFARHWVSALGTTMEAFKQKQAAMKGSPKAWLPFVLAFGADL